MVTRRNAGRADGHTGNGDDASETTLETDNPVLQRILRRMDQLQEQNQTLQEQNETLQTQGTPLKDYDGTTDPQAHVTAFKTQMLKRGYRRCSTMQNGVILITHKEEKEEGEEEGEEGKKPHNSGGIKPVRWCTRQHRAMVVWRRISRLR
ncbi:potassium transporter [Sesbania bispinosa]|nr:potassium transporter [Sesbania bispinosa]